ncbi:MAG TPA: UDP-N-acetylmuramate dehydrogenase [Flammeovirgaceae bacterium]|nr:UDP-N-acetylmuramate dehydrogenase [Flammeovirgaceae bacterium]
MEIKENQSLRHLNTFGVEARARYLAELNALDELRDLDLTAFDSALVLGGGSNILFTRDYPGLVLVNKLQGIEIVEEDEASALVAAASGVVWQDLVDFALQHNLGGIENLSLIPGTVGAAPIQNIGAYGVELKETFERLEAIELASGKQRLFERADCRFGYRDSIFKHEVRDRYLITRVYLRLRKQPAVNTSYGAIEEVLRQQGITYPTIHDVSRAVISIRRSKLPDPAIIGNAGSFFKNPVINKAAFERLKRAYPAMLGYEAGQKVKIPAAWLIEQCGWKGKRQGQVGVHSKQPLVLVNFGGGSGKEIAELARDIQQSVADKFDIVLEPEPRII